MGEFPAVEFEQWQRRVERELGGAGGLERLAADTPEGICVRPLYVECEPDGAGFPGLEPFTRGASPVPRHPPWERLQRYAGHDLAAVAAQVREDVGAGVDGIWLSLAGEHTAAGVSAVLAAAFAARRPVSVMLDAGAHTLPAAAVTLAALRRLGRDPAVLRLRWGADPLAAAALAGTLPAEPETLVREAAVLFGYGGEHLPRARALGVSSAPYARAGADAALQIACAAATALEYLRWLGDAGVAPDVAARQIVFSFETGRDFLLEVCKLRAFRLVWSKAQRACGLAPSAPFVHGATAWRTFTRRDPYGNLLRATVQAAAAAFGGARAVTVTPFDALLPPGEVPGHAAGSSRGRRLARNLHALLQEEAALAAVLDPAGGSYAVETLTEELARGAWQMLRQIEEVGMAEALTMPAEASPLRRLLSEASERRRQRLREGRDAVLGVSHYPPPEELEFPRRRAAGGGAAHTAAPAGRTRASDDGEGERAGRAVAGADGAGTAGWSPAGANAALEAVRAAAAVLVRADTAAGITTAAAARLMEALVAAATAGVPIAQLGAALRSARQPLRIEPLPVWRDEQEAAPAREECG